MDKSVFKTNSSEKHDDFGMHELWNAVVRQFINEIQSDDCLSAFGDIVFKRYDPEIFTRADANETAFLAFCARVWAKSAHSKAIKKGHALQNKAMSQAMRSFSTPQSDIKKFNRARVKAANLAQKRNIHRAEMRRVESFYSVTANV